MDETVIVDCTLGALVRRPLSEAETAQRMKDLAEAERVQRDRDTAERDRDTALGKLAKAAGLSIGEVKHAVGVGRDSPVPDPDKLKRRAERRRPPRGTP